MSNWRALSEYYELLGSSEKARHMAKLEAVGLNLEDEAISKENFQGNYDHLASTRPRL